MPTITLLYAGLLALVAAGISSVAGFMRGKMGVSVGDGGNRELLVAMRRHANFVETVPLALILLGLLELNGISATALHTFGIVLVITRICHAVGLRADTASNPLRGIGAGGTMLATVVMAIWGIINYF